MFFFSKTTKVFKTMKRHVRNRTRNSFNQIKFTKFGKLKKKTVYRVRKRIQKVRRKYRRLSPNKQKLIKILFVSGILGVGFYSHAPIRLVVNSASLKAGKSLKNFFWSNTDALKPEEVSIQDASWKSLVTHKNIARVAIIVCTVAVISLAQDSSGESAERPVSFDLLARSTPPQTESEKQQIVSLVTNIGRYVLHAIATSGFYGVSLVGSYSNIWCYFYCANECPDWALFKCLRAMMPIAALHPTLARLTTYSTHGPYINPDFYEPIFNSYYFMP